MPPVMLFDKIITLSVSLSLFLSYSEIYSFIQTFMKAFFILILLWMFYYELFLIYDESSGEILNFQMVNWRKKSILFLFSENHFYKSKFHYISFSLLETKVIYTLTGIRVSISHKTNCYNTIYYSRRFKKKIFVSSTYRWKMLLINIQFSISD